ncbi:sorting nexin-14 [Nematostella vectensis]|uniref:sorting nexin-14 n=1 Tax=Nematostella vectensis TaxID=45351 RepID=UPI0020772825|nr:sorting nexin-14 [Nematostella vectensis]
MERLDAQDLSRLKPTLAAGSVCVVLFTFQFFRCIPLVIALWVLASGIAAGFVLFSCFPRLPCLLLNIEPRIWVKYEDDDKLLTPQGCTICGNPHCQRHRPEIALVKIQPWQNLKIPESVDKAIEEFLDLVLKNFVYSWYSEVSSDEICVDELRTSLRYITSVLLRRARKVDIPTLVTDRLIKEGLRHFDNYIKAKERVLSSDYKEDIQTAIMDELAPSMHCAMYSRHAELQYLRKIAESVLPQLLPPQSLHCRSLMSLLRELLSGAVLLTAMDKLSDPDFVNNLWLVFLDKNPMVASSELPSDLVPILSKFSRPRAPMRNSALHLSLADILHTQSVLFPFMQFMRKEAALNVLQFCLTIEDFNKRFFAPDLTQEEADSLSKEAQEMFKMYFEVNALDRINFEPNIVEGLKQSLAAPVNKMERLKMAALLSKAYEHAYNLLEGTFIPMFYQSDDYFSLLCGSRLPAKPLPRPAARASKKKFDPLADLSKLAGKIREKVFNPTREERAFYEEDPYDVIDTPPEFVIESYAESTADQDLLSGSEQRDLSTWKITIPHVIMETKHKCIYIISVGRSIVTDGGDRRWDVARRYGEFYVLHSKLRAFHGAIDDTYLPPKKSSSKMSSVKKPATYYESCRQQFERYLQYLSGNPLLKGSALLYNFLSPEKEFSEMFGPSSVGNLAGKTFKSVTTIFTKEKGQNLDHFLSAFQASTEEPVKRRPPVRSLSVDAGVQTNDFGRKEEQCYPDRSRSYGVSSDANVKNIDNSKTQLQLTGVTEYVMFVANRLFKLPSWMLHLMTCFQIVGQASLNFFADIYLGEKVELLKDEYRLVMIIHLLRDAIFFDQDPPRTDADKIERREQTLIEMLDFIPEPVVRMMGGQRHHNGMVLLLELFQHPKLNKQLAYVLLDVLLEEMFPELSQKDGNIEDSS